MSNRSFNWFIVSAMTILFTTMLHAEEREFTYKIKSYPAIGDCQEVAEAIGDTFKAQTKVAPIESRCTDVTRFGFDIEILYSAEKPLDLITTDPGMTQLGVSSAAFDSADACAGQLPVEISVFRAQTKLSPLLSYCYQEDSFRRDGWVARIDAFGAATRRPYLTGAILLEKPASTDLTGVRDGITARLAARGVDVRFVRIRDAGLQGDLSMLYYAAAPFRLELTQHVKVTRREECEEQLELSRQIFAEAPSSPLSMYCASSFVGGTYYVMAFYQNGSGLREVAAPERYVRYGDCMAARAGVLADHRSRLGDKVMGALCSLQDEGPFDNLWRVLVIRK